MIEARRWIRESLAGLLTFGALWAACPAFAAPPEAPPAIDHLLVLEEGWAASVVATREKFLAAKHDDASAVADELWRKLEEAFPIPSDWLHQDLGALRDDWFGPEGDRQLERQCFERLAEGLPAEAKGLRDEMASLLKQCPPRSDPRWLDLYMRGGAARREARLANLRRVAPRIVYLEHHNLAGSHYAYTEGQSDAQAERHFRPGSAIRVLEFDGPRLEIKTLLEDPHGVIRDPDVSFDGRRLLFAWKKSDRLDDYHLYEMDVASGSIRQLTFGLGVADYEGIYLPDGNLLFNSTRCVQIVDCWWTEVSNLYTCDGDGRAIRRLSFDQVHTNYPQLLDDGRVVYTRWEYNDRGQIFPQPLFQMNPDGTNQTEFYGNNSFFPTSILHARGLPGSHAVVAVASGHHSSQAGKLVIIDPARGRQEAAGVQLIAPERPTPAVKVDSYGQDGDQFMYPYALSDREFLVSYVPERRKNAGDHFGGRYAIYWIDRDGHRELLANNRDISCCQALPLAPRADAAAGAQGDAAATDSAVRPRMVPRLRPSLVDPRKDHGVFYLHDVYQGPGLAGIARGTIKSLRVVSMDFRAAGVGHNGNYGALVSTPVSVGNGAWDPKIVLGTTPVHDDGSAMFKAPARTPVFFQALDADGQMVQTMRSWSTLQPGEVASCVGCHEEKNQAPPSYTVDSLAMQGGPRELDAFYGPPRGFSFPKEIQPILDRHCIGCHDDRSQLAWLDRDPDLELPKRDKPRVISLLGETTLDEQSKRLWSDSYLVLTGARRHDRDRSKPFIADWDKPWVNWVGAQTAPTMLPPYRYGAAKSKLTAMLRDGHEGVKLSKEELDKIACWIDLAVPFGGDYYEGNAWTPEERAKYDHFLAKRQRLEAPAGESAGDAANAIEMSIAVVDGEGKTVGQSKGKVATGLPLALELPRPWQKGDRVQVRGAKHVAINLDATVGEALVYAPNETLDFAVPDEALADGGRAYPPAAFRAERPRVTVRPASFREVDTYRNLALNPYAARGPAAFFPQATSNSECRGAGVFAARNAIDGKTDNRGHGAWPYQSWGPEKVKDAWWQVDFGREVQVDKVVVTLRADFPHDKHWKRATLQFLDGSYRVVDLEATDRPQSFSFRWLKTTGFRVKELRQDEPLGWSAIAEIEVYGRDPLPIAGDPDAPACQ
jgi:hypothetical protein